MSAPIIPFEIGPGGRDERPGAPNPPSIVTYHRTELSQILTVYGRMVTAGEWRDYAIDCLQDAAVFSIFRQASENPIYRIEKHPALSRRQGAWRVVSMSGQIMRRGHDLSQVLKIFDRQKLKLVP